MQLIRDKMKSGQDKSAQRDRSQSSFEKPIGVFLEYEDCGFTQLVEPTLYKYQHSKNW